MTKNRDLGTTYGSGLNVLRRPEQAALYRRQLNVRSLGGACAGTLVGLSVRKTDL